MAEENVEDVFVSLDVALTRVIGELTEMRIRQRALLEVLNTGEFSWPQYVDAVRTVRNRDFDALFGAIVYRQETFVERFKEWMDSDMQRYLYHTGRSEPKSVTPKKGAKSRVTRRAKKT